MFSRTASRRFATVAGLTGLLALVSGTANAATLYVAKNGSDSSTNPYNINTPFYSLSKAAQWA